LFFYGMEKTNLNFIQPLWKRKRASVFMLVLQGCICFPSSFHVRPSLQKAPRIPLGNVSLLPCLENVNQNHPRRPNEMVTLWCRSLIARTGRDKCDTKYAVPWQSDSFGLSGEYEVGFGEPEISWRTRSFDGFEDGLVYNAAQIPAAFAGRVKSQPANDGARSPQKGRGDRKSCSNAALVGVSGNGISIRSENRDRIALSTWSGLFVLPTKKMAWVSP